MCPCRFFWHQLKEAIKNNLNCVKSEELLTQYIYNACFNRQLIEPVRLWLCVLEKLPVCSVAAGLVIPFA